MGENSLIGWTDNTFNVWVGCARVSRACRFCYAAKQADRFGDTGLWRKAGPRKFLSDGNWAKPLRWNREAAQAGIRIKVFCSSMADVFERHPDPEVDARMDSERARLWALIMATPHLIWQLLTKRPENVMAMTPWGAGQWPDNVWVGASVENQREAENRISILGEVPARVRFLSVEPLVEPVDLTWWMSPAWAVRPVTHPALDAPDGALVDGWERVGDQWQHQRNVVDWVIVGGESGTQSKVARMNPAWVHDVRDQAEQAGVPFFFKQTGTLLAREWGLTAVKGDRADEWPIAFPQDFPAAAMAGAAA